jgi:hypothetical protein
VIRSAALWLALSILWKAVIILAMFRVIKWIVPVIKDELKALWTDGDYW